MSRRRPCRMAARIAGPLLLAAVAWLSAAGCAAHGARPYQRERLSDPIVSFQAEAKKDARMTRSLEAREGSTGGHGGAGGGCACK